MKCPIHKVTMDRTLTKYGYRYDCTELGCTMMCWGGETSTPADQETRDLRRKAHSLFDMMDMRKGKRYQWLQKEMNLSPQKAHIGMFNAEQCRELIQKLENFNEIN